MAEIDWNPLNNEMIAIGQAYKVDGDVMECRCCGRRLHASRMGERLSHGTDRRGNDCKHDGDANPWGRLAAALDQVRALAGTATGHAAN